MRFLFLGTVTNYIKITSYLKKSATYFNSIYKENLKHIINIVESEDMKIRIEVDDGIKEDEVIIKCSQLNDDVLEIQKLLNDIFLQRKQLTFYKDNAEYYISLSEILFFETEQTTVSAHTFNNVYQVKYKLYELEKILPKDFIMISKSTILNINYVYSITRNLTSSSIVEFQKTHKKVYVSRHYYKLLKNKLLEKRR